MNAGADHIIVNDGSDFSDRVHSLTNNIGVDVVFDGSGPESFNESIRSLRIAGTFCWYGPVLGPVTNLSLTSLPNSIKIGYATYYHHIRTPELLRDKSNQLFEWYLNGSLHVQIGGTYTFDNIAKAHIDMESRNSTGKLLLIP
ncbi:zinc-binding dehydrogenase [Providencia rettgeri]